MCWGVGGYEERCGERCRAKVRECGRGVGKYIGVWGR